jgi:hypothetical protein
LQLCSLFVLTDKTGLAMGLDHVRNEIELMHRQILRQRKEIQSLQRAGISTMSAKALLQRMQEKVDDLCRERNRLVGESRLTGEGRGNTTRPISSSTRPPRFCANIIPSRWLAVNAQGAGRCPGRRITADTFQFCPAAFGTHRN